MQTVSEDARQDIERQTGQLFGQLWNQYDDELYKQSVLLFEKRWLANGEDPEFFKGKRCLDVGCGGGRYTMAMALMGASSVIGVDVGGSGLEDARQRGHALALDQVGFQVASALDLPFSDGEFDFVCCSGVLHHTPGVERGLQEIHRVLKPGGSVYLLLYGAGGLYWPLNLVMRSYAQALGQDEVERCVQAAGIAANKRRTVLDDLFVPILETYTRERVDFLLSDSGFAQWRRWGGGQMDQESDPTAMAEELEIRTHLWQAGAGSAKNEDFARIENHLAELCRTVVAAARDFIRQGEAGTLSEAQLHEAVIGTGHHRLIAEKT